MIVDNVLVDEGDYEPRRNGFYYRCYWHVYIIIR